MKTKPTPTPSRALALLVLLALAAPAVRPAPAPAAAAGLRAQLLYHQVAKLKAADAAPDDGFGLAIAISGDTALVGAPYDDDAGYSSGAAYIFQYDPAGPGWVQVAKLAASDASAAQSFGQAVALAGDTAIVGAPVVVPGGAAYVFQRDQGGPGAWGQVAKVTGLDTTWNDYFGYSLGLDGDTLVVGAYAGGDYDGRAYVFSRDAGGTGAWGQVAYLAASDVQPYDYFGSAVAVSGDTAIIGACGAGDNSTGAAYIFRRDQGGPGAWGEVTKLTLAGGQGTDWFGLPVVIAGDTAVVSAPGRAPDGAAYLFYRDLGGPDAWGQAGQVSSGDPLLGSGFGAALDIRGDTLAVGAPGYDPGGAAYLFARHQGGPDAWGQVARLEPADAHAEVAMGASVALSGDLLAAGATGDEPGGAAYLFLLSNTPPANVELPGGPLPASEGAPMLLTGHFSDPDVGDQFTATVAWGDGETSPAQVSGSPPTYTLAAGHTYAEGPAAYPITVTVTDLAGASASATATVAVDNVAPTLGPLPDREVDAGTTLTVTVAWSDPGALDGHTVAIGWSAGHTWTVAVSPGVTELTAAHAYTVPARYTVTVVVADDDGGQDRGAFLATVGGPRYGIYLPLLWRQASP